MFFSGGHYRQPIAFDDDAMAQAAARVAGIREAARRLVDGPSPEDMAVHREAFFDALADDFNTARALATSPRGSTRRTSAPASAGPTSRTC